MKKQGHFAIFNPITGVFIGLFTPVNGLIYSGDIDFTLFVVDLRGANHRRRVNQKTDNQKWSTTRVAPTEKFDGFVCHRLRIGWQFCVFPRVAHSKNMVGVGNGQQFAFGVPLM